MLLVSVDLDIDVCAMYANDLIAIMYRLLGHFTRHNSLILFDDDDVSYQANSLKPSPTHHLLNHHWKLQRMRWLIMRIN